MSTHGNLRRTARSPDRYRRGMQTAVAAIITLTVGVATIAIPCAAADNDTATPPAGPPPTQTENTKAVTIDEIVVTGSRIRRSEYETAQPILSLDHDYLERSGRTNLGEILQNLAVAGSAVNSTVSVDIANAAGTEFNLRHLGSDRTLVLVNGRRWLGGVGIFRTGTPDLSAIPLAIIERVDVLKDGASAIYGTDAVAGVVNIITRKDFDGTEAHAEIGQFLGHGDGTAGEAGLSYGRSWEGGNVFADVSYGKDRGVLAKDRRISREPVLGAGLSRTDPFNAQGRFLFVPDPDTVTLPCAVQGFCDLTLIEGEDGQQQTDFRPYDPTRDNFNYSLGYPLSFPTERWSLFSTAQQEITEGVSASLEAYTAHRTADQVFPDFLRTFVLGDLGSPPPNNAIYVAADNPSNPFGQDIGRADPQTGIGSGQVLRINPELGRPGLRTEVNDLRLAAALQGEVDAFEREINWEAGVIGSRSTGRMRSDELSLSHLARALGPPADCAADPACVPINVFGSQGVDGQGSIRPDAADYVSRHGDFNTRNRVWQLYANASQDLLSLPAGPAQIAYGLEYRHEAYRFVPDSLTQTGDSVFGVLLSGRGNQSVFEGFVELELPLLSDLPGAQSLDLNLALRHSDYSGLDAVDKGRVSLRWQPLDSLVWRATFSQGFRAAPLGLRYFGGGPLFVTVADPCSQWAQSTDENLRANCAADGVPADYTQPDGLVRFFNRGNRDLAPEESRTLTTGFVLSPVWLPGLSLTLDWYRIDLDHAISQYRPQFVLDNCYRQTQPGITCPLIDRVPDSGIFRQVDLPYANLDRTKVTGLDFSLDWQLPLPRGYGRFDYVIEAAHLYDYTNYILQSDGSRQREELAGTNQGSIAGVAYPKLKANGTLNWTLHRLQAGWTLRYISSLTESCNDGGSPSLVDLGLCSDPNHPSGPRNRLSATLYHDVLVGYTLLNGDLHVQAGVNNLFDNDPPATVTGVLASYNASLYDIPGRYGFVRMNWAF